MFPFSSGVGETLVRTEQAKSNQNGVAKDVPDASGKLRHPPWAKAILQRRRTWDSGMSSSRIARVKQRRQVWNMPRELVDARLGTSQLECKGKSYVVISPKFAPAWL